MRTLNSYITRDFLVTFGITLGVVTGVMCLGVLKQAIDVASRGISIGIVLQVFGLNLPFMLTFTIPFSLLVASLLVFGRLSFDGEITALKACGVSLWQAIAPVLCIAVAMSVLCLLINSAIAPRCRWEYRSMLARAGGIDPVALLEPGSFIRDFPGLQIYISSREGNRINDVIVFQSGTNGLNQQIKAEYGIVRTDPTNAVMHINLHNVRNDARLPGGSGDDGLQRIVADEYPYTVDLRHLSKKQQISRKTLEMSSGDLARGASNVAEIYPGLEKEELQRKRMMMLVEANRRIALSLSCFGFVLVGIPLGMKSRRKESSVGIGISLGIVALFYMFILIASNLVNRPQIRPDLIVWIPAIASQILGYILIRRAN